MLNQIKVWTGIDKHIFWIHTGVKKSKFIDQVEKKSLEFVNSSRALTIFNIAES